MDSNNENIRRLPKHLRQYIVDQNYAKYTAVDHSVWRYIMRLNLDFLKVTAHESYAEALVKTGISIERIPKLEEMNEILSAIGWGAVCVDGFIPPAAFMEFQAWKVLVIAADIRNIKHIDYTPAPDIVHEAAGHAPIIVNPAYAEYLRLFGEIGSKAISSSRDNDLYEAIRKLSILKENPFTTKEDIEKAENELNEIQKNMGKPSEMARLRNLHWWTVEYGLIGSIEKPRIYGAGLLSSIGESSSCLGNDVKKIPYSIEAADYSFDITTKQPQLFVSPDFSHLLFVLNEFADSMALRSGGKESIDKAIESKSLATCQLSSGLQISGIFSRLLTDEQNRIAYLNTAGPTMLSENDLMITGHGKNVHHEGFGTPIGKLKNLKVPLEEMDLKTLANNHIRIGQKSSLVFESGVMVEGVLQYIHQNKFGKILLLSFTDCEVRLNNEILFHPDWGNYDMAVGEEVVSVYGGAADKSEYEIQPYVSSTITTSNNYSDESYVALYQEVRNLREKEFLPQKLLNAFQDVKQGYPDEWLIILEIYELASKHQMKEKNELKQYLSELYGKLPEHRKLIEDGLKLIEK